MGKPKLTTTKSFNLKSFVRDHDGILRGVEFRDVHDHHHHDVDLNENSCERIHQHMHSK